MIRETRPEQLLKVAGILKKMVGTLVSDIIYGQCRSTAIQKASGTNHHAFFQELMISKSPSCLVGTSPPSQGIATCIPSKDSKTAKSAVLKDGVICRHTCEYHPEVVDPRLWRKLPQELVELVFAKLPLPLIPELRECSKAWYTMSKSFNFREACSASHPRLFGLLGWDIYGESIRSTLYDMKSNEWLGQVELVGFPGRVTYGDWEPNGSRYSEADAYRNSMCACDGGLVCFVPQEHYFDILSRFRI